MESLKNKKMMWSSRKQKDQSQNQDYPEHPKGRNYQMKINWNG